MKGMSRSDKLDRRHMLVENEAQIRAYMQQASMDEPVGFIVDISDTQGRNFAQWIYQGEGLSEAAAAKRVADEVASYMGKAIPTMMAVLPMSAAKKVLPLSSPMASVSLKKWEEGRQPGQYLVVVMASGGNTYASMYLGFGPLCRLRRPD